VLGHYFSLFWSPNFLSYQVIARKWRPQNFDQLVGQNHISQTLTNALKNGRLPHALLFTGPRGTGKTSSARILAKSLRCENSVDFMPCGACSSCLEIASGRATDVIEIDGASNNGVDSIRELREGVAFMPSSGKYKIYIIDEVHMLSTSAFNALLKTLEEPPAHVVFILATTEAQKIPQTILSRCQRFDFRRIPTRVIADRMVMICKEESISASDEALWVIARQGDGSMRDAFSLLDQVITFSNGALEKNAVIEILGLTDRSLLIETLTALIQRDTAATLKILEKLARAGYEPSLFAKDLLENLRCTLLIKLSGENPPEMVDLPDSEIRFLRELGQSTTEEDLHLLFDMALKGASDIPKSSEPRIVLEMALLRMTAAPSMVDIKRLLQGSFKETSAPIRADLKPAVTISKKPTNAPVPAKAAIAFTPSERWFEFVQKVRETEALLAAKIENLLFLGETIGEKKKTLELAVPLKMSFLREQILDPATRKKLQSLVDTYFGSGYAFEIKSEEKSALKPEGAVSAQKLGQAKEKQKEDDIAKQVADHPMMKSATSVFKGSFKIKNP
jgi:DNA polymerase III subunit gamma/tau